MYILCICSSFCEHRTGLQLPYGKLTWFFRLWRHMAFIEVRLISWILWQVNIILALEDLRQFIGIYHTWWSFHRVLNWNRGLEEKNRRLYTSYCTTISQSMFSATVNKISPYHLVKSGYRENVPVNLMVYILIKVWSTWIQTYLHSYMLRENVWPVFASLRYYYASLPYSGSTQ